MLFRSRLSLSPRGFDVIAEVKLRSPAIGALKGGDENVAARVGDYAGAGAAASGTAFSTAGGAAFGAGWGFPRRASAWLAQPITMTESAAINCRCFFMSLPCR